MKSSALEKIEAIVFDYDGTLVLLNIDFGAMRREVEATLPQYGIVPHELRDLYILEMIEEATRRITQKSPPAGAAFQRQSLRLVTAHEIRAARRGKILPGIVPMLALLRQRNVRVGVITRNCDQAVKMVFPQIEELCDAYIPRDGTDRVKPHPDHLAQVLKRLGVRNAGRCWMVGDHLLDIEGGKRMKMRTAGVLTGKTRREEFVEAGADLVLQDATGVIGHLFEEQTG